MTRPEGDGGDAPYTRLAQLPSQQVAGVRITALDLQQTAQVMADLVGGADGFSVFTCNVDHVMLLRSDPTFARAYEQADLVTADGAPVVALARVLGGPVRRRVTGSDLLPELAAVAARRGLALALVGGRNGVAARAAEILAERHPGLAVTALPPPPFGFLVGGPEDRTLVAALQAFGPALVVVGLGAPKQESWIATHVGELPGSVLLGAGASMDFVVGEQRRAPLLWQRMGVEFLWRLLNDWPRLWRRYLLRDSRFAVVAAQEILRRRTPIGRWRTRAEAGAPPLVGSGQGAGK